MMSKMEPQFFSYEDDKRVRVIIHWSEMDLMLSDVSNAVLYWIILYLVTWL